MGSRRTTLLERPLRRILPASISLMVMLLILGTPASGGEKLRVRIPAHLSGSGYAAQTAAASFPAPAFSTTKPPQIRASSGTADGFYADVDITSATGAIFTVTTTADSGPGSLRKAIEDANASPGRDSIIFAIGSGSFSLAPLSPLPSLLGPVVIDATTEPGYSGSPLIELQGASLTDGLTLLAGNSAVRGLVINACPGSGIVISGPGNNVIEGCFIGVSAAGTAPVPNGGYGVYILDSPSNRIGGTTAGARNVLAGNYWPQVTIEGSASIGNIILGNYIGIDKDGGAPITSNTTNGIFVRKGASQTVVGGTSAGARNVIAGFPLAAIGVNASFGTFIYGNLIGANMDASVLIPNGNGIRITAGSQGTQVGDGTSAGRNYIGGSSDLPSIVIDTDGDPTVTSLTTNNAVRGNNVGVGFVLGALPNFIGIEILNSPGNVVGDTLAGVANLIANSTFSGISITGDTSRANHLWGNHIVENPGMGVRVYNAPGNFIGGSQALAGNVIDRNRGHGIRITGNSPGTIIQQNRIGTDPNPIYEAARGNLGHGILCVSSGLTIGGDTTALGNVIGYNALAGILDSAGTGNRISHNSIFNNVGYGIALGTVGLTVNDSLDADTGPNQRQNFPILDSISYSASSTRIRGHLDSTPAKSFTLEFFSSAARHASLFGEGETFIGSATVVTDNTGRANITETLPVAVAPERFITATATDQDGNTSQFSRALCMVDTDGDGLLDIWEKDGIDVNADGVIDLNLAARGADPLHKDLFVEVDWMEDLWPLPGVLDKVAVAFRNAPRNLVSNPDGQPGIELHIDAVDTDGAIPVAAWGADPWAEFSAAKKANFGSDADRADPNARFILEAKKLVYRYCIFARSFGASGASGQAFNIPGNDFFVSLGLFPVAGGSPEEQAGTFMHELGHSLGLGHGGAATDEDTWKPNYYSVMNYMWQFPRDFQPGAWKLDYSRSTLPSLDENHLVDSLGLNPRHLPYPTLKIPYNRPDNSIVRTTLSTANTAVDWDGDRDSSGRSSRPVTIHWVDHTVGAPAAKILTGHTDWPDLVYNFRNQPGFITPERIPFLPSAVIQTLADEMTVDMRNYMMTLPSYGIEAPLSDWSGDVATATPLDVRFQSQSLPVAASDGAGGAIVAWGHNPGGYGKTSVYAQRIDSLGDLLWRNNGIAVSLPGRGSSTPAIAPDGAKGAFIAWYDRRDMLLIPHAPANVYLQRINDAGRSMWTEGGVCLSQIVNDSDGTFQQVISDGASGAIVVWKDRHSGVASLYAQRVNQAGVPQWTPGGVLVTATPWDYVFNLVSDDSAGVIVVWDDSRAITPSDPSNSDLYAQRIDAGGTRRWISTGVPICVAPSSQRYPATISDEAGGAITVWQDYRAGISELYGQRVDAAGKTLWAIDGVPVSTGPGVRVYPVMVGDGAGGGIVAWNASFGSGAIKAQRIDATGSIRWNSGGQTVSALQRDTWPLSIVSDNRHGALVGYSCRLSPTTGVYVQRIDSAGVTQWPAGGTKISLTDSYDMGFATDNGGGAICTYLAPNPGGPAGGGGQAVLYAQKVNSGGGMGGNVLTGVVRPPEEIPSAFALLQNFPNPFNPSTTIAFTMARPAIVSIILYDVLGRKIRTVVEGRYGAGTFTAVWDGRNDAGMSVATGVYFVAMRVEAGNQSGSAYVTVKKMMLLR